MPICFKIILFLCVYTFYRGTHMLSMLRNISKEGRGMSSAHEQIRTDRPAVAMTANEME